MKKKGIILILLLSFAITISANAQSEWGYKLQGVDYNYVIRTSSALSNTYIQLSNDLSFHPKWVNLTPGIEFDFSYPGITRYFLQEKVNITDTSSIVARLNHLQYKDWEVGANFINLYFSQTLPKVEWSAGAVYIAQLLEDYQNPVNFNDELYQLRVLYSVAYVNKFYKDKFDFRVGAENFTQYENYGYDQLGPFFKFGWQITERTNLAVKVDLRIVGIGTATPHLEKETYMFLIDWRNLPKKPKAQ